MKRLGIFLSCFVSLLLIGCGGTVDGRLPTYKLTGSVKYQGKSLEDADVILHFLDHDRVSFGRTNAAGEFSLATYEHADGALAGEAFISITKWEQLPPSTEPIAGQPGYDPSKAYAPEKEPKLLVPKKYTNIKTSGLRTVVEASDNNPPLNLELTD